MLENWNKFNLHFFYDFYLYHAYNDVIWSFFQVQNKWRTRNSKEGGYGALNPDTNTSMLHLRSKIWFIINSSRTFYLYHADNVVLWSFFQIQNNWSFRKLKQGRYKALMQDINTSMLCLKIEINLIIISFMTKMLKEGRYGALNPETNTSMLHIIFEINSSAIFPWLFFFIMQIMMFCDHSFTYKTTGDPES